MSGRQRARQGLEGAGCWLWSPSPANRAGRPEAALSPSGEWRAERPTDSGVRAPLLCHALHPELLCGYCFSPPGPKPPPKTSPEVPPPSHMESTVKPSVAAQRGERKAPILGRASRSALRGTISGLDTRSTAGLSSTRRPGSSSLRAQQSDPPPRPTARAGMAGDGVGEGLALCTLGKGCVSPRCEGKTSLEMLRQELARAVGKVGLTFMECALPM